MLLVGVCLSAPAAADEARPRTGRPVPGTLRLNDGRLHFVPRAGDPPLPAAGLECIRIDAPSPPAFPIGFARRILFPDGQRLTGEFLDLDKDALHMRTAWANRLEVPRAAAAALTALPGWRLRFAEDFGKGLTAWKVAGKPTGGGSPPAVVLDSAGQELSHTLSWALTAGRVGVNFEDREKPSSAHWDFEAIFGTDKGASRALRVAVAGDGDRYRVEVPGIPGEALAVPRAPGVHRLIVQFTDGSLRVTCDDLVLWYTLKQGPPGPLRQVRLICRAVDGSTPTGGVAWSDCTIEQAVDEQRRPDGDAAQDAMFLYDGDQWFGTVRRAGRWGVEVQGRFGLRTLGWDQVEGCSFRRAAPPPRTTAGAHVRLEIASGLDPQKDILEGVLRSWDDRGAMLEHPRLGELRLPRPFVRRIWPLFFGRRIELDLGFHHLGDAGRLDPRLDPPRAEGPSWRCKFSLEGVPEEVRLVLEVVGLSKAADTEGPATAVVVNGRRVSYLNAQVDRASAQPQRLALALPRDALRAGANVIELRQTPDPKTGRHAHCGVFGIALEIPQPERGAPP
jgi:hypothetical protein